MYSSREIIRQSIDSIIQLISPNICLVCENISQNENYKFDFLCKQCYDNLPLFNPSENLTLRQYKANINANIAIDKAFSLISAKSNDKYFNLIHYFKYSNYRKIGEILGEQLAKYMQINQFPEFDFIIPIPLHSAKKKERGYNQSDLIATGISNIYKIQYFTNLTKRTVYTKSQTLTNQTERFLKMQGIYEITNRSDIINKNILICDDVFTTGSTINSLAIELKKAGADKVFSATLFSIQL